MSSHIRIFQIYSHIYSVKKGTQHVNRVKALRGSHNLPPALVRGHWTQQMCKSKAACNKIQTAPSDQTHLKLNYTGTSYCRDPT